MGEERRKAAEFTGKTVDQAIETGLAELGISRDDAQIQIISEGSRGILGIGAEAARVLITPLAQPESHAVEPPSAISDDMATVARETVEYLLEKMAVRAQVTVRLPDSSDILEAPPLILDVTGDDLGILIGRRGETLAALQFITRLIVSRKIHRWINLVVDVEHYKERRERRLKDLARSTAERVIREGRALSLQAMPSHERRIIHLVLRDHPDIVTMSIGQGERRKVTIRPRT